MTVSGCQQCGENSFSGDGASSCDSCPEGKVSSAGSSSVDDCYYGNNYSLFFVVNIQINNVGLEVYFFKDFVEYA